MYSKRRLKCDAYASEAISSPLINVKRLFARRKYAYHVKRGPRHRTGDRVKFFKLTICLVRRHNILAQMRRDR